MHARGPLHHARHGQRRAAVPMASRADVLAEIPTDTFEFVRFCYRRRPVSWPALYDEMSAVAARGCFRGLGYAELADIGVSFCLTNLPRLAAAAEVVIAEERVLRDGYTTDEPARIAMAPQPAG